MRLEARKRQNNDSHQNGKASIGQAAALGKRRKGAGCRFDLAALSDTIGRSGPNRYSFLRQIRAHPKEKRPMAIALYDLSVSCFLQTLGAVSGFMEKGLAHCRDNNIDPAEIVETRLFPDMAPFRFQIQSVAHHSFGAIEAVKVGVFQPPGKADLPDYASLQKLVADARAGLEAMKATEVNALEGKDVSFQFREIKMPFVAEGFLLSFSLPNFYFHATTAYDILRSKGVPVGKRDFMGRLRLKG
jgi:uncharacterized protein